MIANMLGLVARFIRPIESAVFSFAGLTVANGAGVDSASVSTSAALAGVIAACHLAVELFNDIRNGHWADAKSIVSEVAAAAEALNNPKPGA